MPNNMKKFETHLHTAENDIYAYVKAKDAVRLYKDAGYTGIVVTDHYFATFFEWFGDELSGADHRKIIDRWLKGYNAAREEGEKQGLIVLPGAEVRFDGVANDYLVYGLEAEDFYHLPLLNRLKGVRELLEVLPSDTCVVQAHPFRNRMRVVDPTRLFGLEAYNAGTEAYRNTMARNFAEHYNKPMTSGSDMHHADACAKGGICFEREVVTPKDFVDLLRSGEYYLIEDGKVQGR